MNRLMLLLMLCCTSMNVFSRTLIIGVENIHYYPIYDVRDGQYRGFNRDLLDSFAKLYGYTLVYKPLPVKRLLREFDEGLVDFKFPDNPYWTKNEKEGKVIIYSKPTLEYIDGTLVAPAKLGQGKDKIKKLGTILGFTPLEYLDDIRAGKVQIQESNNISNLMKMVQLGRVDAVYFSVQVARYFLNHSNFPVDLVQYDPSLPHTQDYYYLSSIKYPNIIAQFNEFLTKESKLIASLRKKYNLDQLN